MSGDYKEAIEAGSNMIRIEVYFWEKIILKIPK